MVHIENLKQALAQILRGYVNSGVIARQELGLEVGYKEKNAQSRNSQYEKELNKRSQITYCPSDSYSFPEPSPKKKLYTGIMVFEFRPFYW